MSQGSTTPHVGKGKEHTSPSLSNSHYRAQNLYNARDKSVSIMFKPSAGVDKSPNKHYMTTFKQIYGSKKAEQEQHLLPAVQPVTLNNERKVNSTRNAKVSVLAIN